MRGHEKLQYSPVLKRLAIRVVRTALIIFVLLAGLLYFLQERLLFYPRAYPLDPVRVLAGRLQALDWQTSDGAQTAYVLPPRIGDAGTGPIWVFFAGNASRAVDWVAGLDTATRRATLVLVDYPGYGSSRGKPSIASIRRSLDGLIPALVQKLGVTREALAPRLRTGGHSLGAAVALEFAERESVRDIELISPFTSMRAMARQEFGWPLCEVLTHRWDNERVIDVLAGRTPRPRLSIFHGEDDPLIPISMGRALAARHPGWVDFHAIPKASHESIMDSAEEHLRTRLAE